MIYTLSDTLPAKAVDTPDNGKGIDGDGGGTAGTPLVGVEAISALGSQTCKTLHQYQSPGVDIEPSTSRISRTTRARNRRAAQPPSNTGGLGNTPPREGGLAARHTTNPPTEDPPSVALKKRAFRIGTWNTRGKMDPSGGSKFNTAKMIMRLEKVDILVITETHTQNDSPPDVRGLKVLAHTGISNNRAGVAICALDTGIWSCTSSEVLIPGHAIICELYHSISTESLRILGVYGDISDYLARTNFYRRLYTKISDHILELRGRDNKTAWSWKGCIAAGDWNFVEKDDDRFPIKTPSSDVKECRQIFRDIKTLCMLQDTGRRNNSYRDHTFSQNARGVNVLSRLDRIYRPRDGWTSSIPIPIKTNHSDHHFVWSDCFLTNPKVEIAVPAPRLPRMDKLGDNFWSTILQEWDTLTSGDINLHRWTDFKKSALLCGLKIRRERRKSTASRWKEILRGDEISQDQLANLTFEWDTHFGGDIARPAVTSHENRPEGRPRRRRPNYGREDPANTRKAILYPDVSAYTAPIDITPALVSDPPTTTPPRLSLPFVADQLDARIDAMRKAQLKKFREMERLHTSEWYKLSSNKEKDERGSRASISVEGLRRPTSATATTDLKHMLHIAHNHFRDLHRAQEPSECRQQLQNELLGEIIVEYGKKPAPSTILTGNYSLKEIIELKQKMPNTAPGPDGLPYGFYKQLASRIDLAIKNGASLTSFWDAFTDLSNEIRRHGSDRCDFKLANLSLFYKKGDPTLVSNYRPISSMNTDCKMYTNLVNNRIRHWAVTKIHPDQAGFIPGRLITDHTRLTAEVAHLSDVSGTDGYIVSLDQAKAYDKTDVSWMLRVLGAMGVPNSLVSDIKEITSNCRTRVHINSGLSAVYTLSIGLRQGDPLSPILYNFSIEPLGMRMRRCMKGISCFGLAPAKLIQYADDINLFASKDEDFPLVKSVLQETSVAIGNQINLDKTSVQVVGSNRHKEATTHPLVSACFEGAEILPVGAPLRVLGVWIGSNDRASHRWKQVLTHIKLIVKQWNSIGASIRNRVLIAKALLLSRCYYLLDGNGIPPVMLRKINNIVQRFVRGTYSSAPYSILEHPIQEGGLDCPSLRSRVLAYDAKFFSDLISGDQLTTWKVWTMADLDQASVFNSSSKKEDFPGKLNPLLQSCHCRYTMLEPRVRDAWKSLRDLRYDVRCSFPSERAILDMPSVLHPSRRTYHLSKLKCIVNTGRLTIGDLVPREQVTAPRTKRKIPLRKKFINDSDSSGCSDNYEPPAATGRPVSRHTKLRSRIKGVKKLAPGIGSDRKLAIPMSRNILQDLSRTRWDITPNRPTNQKLQASIRIWPNMTNAIGCARILTGNHSLLAPSRLVRDWTDDQLRNNPTKFGPYPNHNPAEHDDFLPTSLDTVHLWTDGSAFNNGLDSCVAGAAWVSSHGAEYSARIIDGPMSNNVAEVVAIVAALLSWRHTDLIIHTDSMYVINLVKGNLLAMERDGWTENVLSLRPPRPWTIDTPENLPDIVSSVDLLRYLLYLLRSHDGYISFRWIKAHNGDTNNSRADQLAKSAASSDQHLFSLATLTTPNNWVDTGPVLNYQSVSSLTAAVVKRDHSTGPSLGDKSAEFRYAWGIWASGECETWLDVTHHIPNIWEINVLVQLRELLWKEINGSLPLGHTWTSKVKLGQNCPCNGDIIEYRHVWISPRCEHTNGLRAIKCRCGANVSLAHMWKGCPQYDMSPFREVARGLIKKVVYLDTPTTDPDRWMSGDMWFPLIALRSLEKGPTYDETTRRILGPSRKTREWIMGSMLWYTWRMRMKESHSPTMVFSPRNDDFKSALINQCSEYTPTANESRFATR